MKIGFVVVAVAVPLLMHSCSGPAQTTGGSTSTDNAKVSARVIFPDGTPVAGAAVRLRSVDYLSDGLTGSPLDRHTDDSGRLSFDSVDSVDYLIEVADTMGNGAAISCPASGDPAIDLGVYTILPMGRIQGTAGGPAVTAYLRIRGLERYAPADASGHFSVSVPSGRGYSVNIAAADTSVEVQLAQTIEPSQTLTVAADLGTFYSDSTAVREFINNLGMTSVPFDSMVRLSDDRRIRALLLRHRNLTTLPASIGNMSFLWEIDIGKNPLDSLPETLQELPLLSHLFLDATPLENLPGVVCRCGNLKWLKLSESAIQTLPAELASLTGLRVLEMGGNALSEVPPAVFSLPSLIELNLAGNQLTALPEAIGACTNMEILHLDDNRLESLPDAITGLRRLKIIYAYRNTIAKLPDSIGRLELLERLELQENRLTSLPASIGACTGIVHLNLWGNEITGFPAAIINLQPSDGLTLGNNRLCTLPQEVAEWANAFAESAWKQSQVCE